MNVWGVTFGGYLAKILSFKSGNLLYKSNFYLLSEATVLWTWSSLGGFIKTMSGEFHFNWDSL